MAPLHRPSRAALIGIAFLALAVVAPASALAHLPGGATAPVTPSVFVGIVTIYPDGSLSSPTPPITVSGGTYTLTAPISGSIIDERNDSTLNGAAFTLDASTGVGAGILLPVVHNVEVKDFQIANAVVGIQANSSNFVSIHDNTIQATNRGILTELSNSVDLTGNLLPNTEGIAVIIGNDIIIDQNNASSATTVGITVELASNVSITNNDATLCGSIGILAEYASAVTIDNNDVHQGSLLGYGIEVAYTQGVTESNNIAGGGFAGVTAFSSSQVQSSGDEVSSGTYGYWSDTTSDLTITDLVAQDEQASGLFLSNGSNIVLQSDDLRNSLTAGATLDNLTGLWFDQVQVDGAAMIGFNLADDRLVTGTDSSASNLTGATNYGFLVMGSSQVALTHDWAVNDYATVWVDHSSSVNVTGGDFANAGASAVAFVDSTDSNLSLSNLDHATSLAAYSSGGSGVGFFANTAIGSSDGVFEVIQTPDVQIVGNDGSGAASFGAIVEFSSAPWIAGNDFSGAGSLGLLVEITPAATVVNNQLDGSGGVALEIYEANQVAAMGNNLSEAATGLILADAVGGTVEGNAFFADTTSVQTQGAAGNTLDHNNFDQDGGWILASANYDANAWDAGYPGGGNYWSNYTGADTQSGPNQNVAGADGIGDTAVTLNATNVDRYPLVGPWTTPLAVFAASGLPANTSWGVDFNGVTYTSTGPAITIPLTNGAYVAYDYAALEVPGYAPTPANGSGTLTGSGLSVLFDFAVVTSEVDFTANGAPAGTSWSVAVTGSSVDQTLGSTGSSVQFNLPNGTYSYAVAPIAGYTISPSTGTFTVAGTSVAITVNFTQVVYGLHFIATGLPAGSTWQVGIGGIPTPSTGTSVSFTAPNGTVTYTVTAPSGYTATPASGSLAVAGGPVTVYVAFTANATGSGTTGTTGSSSSSALPDYAWIALLVILAIVAVLGWVMAMRRRPGGPGPMTPAAPAMSTPPPGVTGTPTPPPGAGGAAPWSEDTGSKGPSRP